MGNENSKTAAVSKTAAATATISSTNRAAAAALPPGTRRLLQNFLLVWLDANLDESKADFKKSLERLRNVVASIITFQDVKECINFLNEISQEKVFMIVSGSLGQQVVPDLEDMPQVQSIYIFCGNKAIHEEWASKMPKVKGIFTEIEPVCNALQIDGKNCDRALVSISFKGIDALFMYTQLLKEAILQIEDDDEKSLKELAEYCRGQKDIPEYQVAKLGKEYQSHTPIWWYTAPYFLYGMLNRGLRVMDAEIIMKTGFFIRHLQQHRQDSKMMHTCLLLSLSAAPPDRLLNRTISTSIITVNLLRVCITSLDSINPFSRQRNKDFLLHSLTSMKISINYAVKQIRRSRNPSTFGNFFKTV